MKALLQFEWALYFRRKEFYILLFPVSCFGLMTGSGYTIAAGPEILKNGPFTIALMTAFLSLFSIFFTTILTTQILFRENEHRFDLIFHSTPIRKSDFLVSRFIAVYTISLTYFLLMMAGFVYGQTFIQKKGLFTDFHWFWYVHPFLCFGMLNNFFCCTVLCSTAWLSKNKVMVYVMGLIIYILYMVMLIFSGSPLMAGGLPQSELNAKISALLDPFGLSGLLYETRNWQVLQRNTELINMSGILLVNRMGVVVVSIILSATTFRFFKFFNNRRSKKSKSEPSSVPASAFDNIILKPIQPAFTGNYTSRAINALTSLDLQYIVKNIAFLLASVGIIFYQSMEMYGAIEKGIRLPEQYASSAVLVNSILDSFYGLCLIITIYYCNEVWWRSRTSNFHLIENATPLSGQIFFFSRWLTMCLIILFFGAVVVILGLIFQLGYGYAVIDVKAYAGVFFFNSLPLMITAGFVLVIQRIVQHRYLGIILSAAFALLATSSSTKKFLKHPLLQFQIPFDGGYSDMNGYGKYFAAYGWNIIFGLCLLLLVTVLANIEIKNKMKVTFWPAITFLLIGITGSSYKILKDYTSRNDHKILLQKAAYEKKFRLFQYEQQPVITAVDTKIDLYPEYNAYDVTADYQLKNNSASPIFKILIHFSNDVKMKSTVLETMHQKIILGNSDSAVTLTKPLLPGDSARLHSRFSYTWAPINGHHSFNAIVENGSFMRISRYYPSIGYDADSEIQDSLQRKSLSLGPKTRLKSIDDKTIDAHQFIRLKMTISTNAGQTAIGIGELTQQWQTGSRSYFVYQPRTPVDFRFAISSASYAVEKIKHRGKNIEVYYHPSHHENVSHLVENTKSSLDYCEEKYGAYSGNTIRFAEVSSFTKGFAATAYPGTIFMTEQMIFHANIGADKKQDVINELASHELSHFWWGTGNIAPDQREGAAMLTETLAMYTELMITKKIYGRERMLENVNLHLGMYLDERGFTNEQPLYKAYPDSRHIVYSKGAVVLYQLSEMLGEEKVNEALANLLKNHAWPNRPALSADLINEIYLVADTSQHAAIDDLLKKITFYEFTATNVSISRKSNKYVVRFAVEASKYYEDGKGNRIKNDLNDRLTIAVTDKMKRTKQYYIPIRSGINTVELLSDEQPNNIQLDPDIKFIRQRTEPTVLNWNNIE
jgi:ABC-2 type transport system permease protein